MFRIQLFAQQRASASLIRALCFGTATFAATLGASTLLVSCEDENAPEYWIEKLQDVAWRPRAIKRLDAFYEGAMTRASGKVDDPMVQEMVGKIIGPLTQTYVDQYDGVDEEVRIKLLKLLATMRDKRAEPALVRALDEFGKKGRGAEEAKWAGRAVAELKLPGAAAAMLAAFTKTRAASKEGASLYRDLSKSMITMADKSWTAALIKSLDARMYLPPKQQDPIKVTEFKNQLFWQTTAAQVLGEIGAAAAAKPLMKVLLDPAKANVHATAIMAMLRVGKPAVAVATSVLLDKDEALATFAAKRTKAAKGMPQLPKDRPHVQMAAIALGMLGQPDSAKSLQTALSAAKIDDNKALLTRELTKVPATKSSRTAFLKSFGSLSSNVSIGNSGAHEVLAESAARFFDASMVPWLLKKSKARKGDAAAQSWMRISAVKLMNAKQVRAVGKVIKKSKDKRAQQAFALAAPIVKSCKSDTSCYLKIAQKSESQNKKKQFAGIKALYMLGVLGTDKTRAELIAGLKPIKNGALRFVASQVIDKLSPKGSAEAVKSLQTVLDDNAKGNNRSKIAADKSLKDVVLRISNRG